MPESIDNWNVSHKPVNERLKQSGDRMLQLFCAKHNMCSIVEFTQIYPPELPPSLQGGSGSRLNDVWHTPK